LVVKRGQILTVQKCRTGGERLKNELGLSGNGIKQGELLLNEERNSPDTSLRPDEGSKEKRKQKMDSEASKKKWAREANVILRACRGFIYALGEKWGENRTFPHKGG